MSAVASGCKLRWSDNQPSIELLTASQLDEHLDRIAAKRDQRSPTIVQIYAHGHELLLGLAAVEGFVQVAPDTGKPSYLVTVGDSVAEGVVSFYLNGTHHTEIPRRHMISSVQAREIVREFVESGHRADAVEWEQV
jgi:hypothetical protein